MFRGKKLYFNHKKQLIGRMEPNSGVYISEWKIRKLHRFREGIDGPGYAISVSILQELDEDGCHTIIIREILPSGKRQALIFHFDQFKYGDLINYADEQKYVASSKAFERKWITKDDFT